MNKKITRLLCLTLVVVTVLTTAAFAAEPTPAAETVNIAAETESPLNIRIGSALTDYQVPTINIQIMTPITINLASSPSLIGSMSNDGSIDVDVTTNDYVPVFAVAGLGNKTTGSGFLSNIFQGVVSLFQNWNNAMKNLFFN